MLEGDTAAEVEGLFSNTGKCTVFENRKIMKYYLFNRIKMEKENKKQREPLCEDDREKKECIRSILDPETNKYVDNRMFDIMKDWIKIEREREARLAEIAKEKTQKQKSIVN